jgi:hypothetical protein
MRILTCKNHTNLRWSCKPQAWTEGVGFNHSRNIFFCGTPSGRGMYGDGSGLDCTEVVGGEVVRECSCSPKDLILAPEDALVTA